MVLFERRQELVNQRGALFNERHFIPAQRTQFSRQRIQRRERAPLLPVGP